MDPARPAVTLLARGADAAQTAAQLPLLRIAGAPLGARTDVAWISEAIQDLYGSYRVGDTIGLPLAGTNQDFRIVGVWRDYARTTGSVVISCAPPISPPLGMVPPMKPPCGSNQARIPPSPNSLLRQRLGNGERCAGSDHQHCDSPTFAADIRSCLRNYLCARGHRRVDWLDRHQFLAVPAPPPRALPCAEFGVLRHVGMLRRQVIGLLASEGVLTSAFGVLYGLGLGFVLSLVLVYVVNRQSFNWSIDLAVPGWQLAVLSMVLIAAAALTAIWSGRAATGFDAVQAVREDW